MEEEINLEELDETLIFHEKQSSALCGRHALNNLLQGPYIDEFALADIAKELDDRERELMFEGGTETVDALKFIAEGSTNVDDSGNFSVTVLKEALSRGYNLHLEADNDMLATALDNPGLHEAYILNLREHWFTIRRLETLVGPKWFNLNSLLKSPEIISDFYLSAFLAEMRAEGYCIFIVTGELPRPLADSTVGAADCWHTVGSVVRMAKSGVVGTKARADARKQAADRARAAAAEDPAYAAALRASLVESDGPKPTHVMDEDEMLQLAMAESLTYGHGASGVITTTHVPMHDTGAQAMDVEADEELKAAIALSLSADPSLSSVPKESREELLKRLEDELPGEDPAGYRIQLRVNGIAESGSEVISRRFPPSATAAALFAWAAMAVVMGLPSRDATRPAVPAFDLLIQGMPPKVIQQDGTLTIGGAVSQYKDDDGAVYEGLTAPLSVVLGKATSASVQVRIKP